MPPINLLNRWSVVTKLTASTSNASTCPLVKRYFRTSVQFLEVLFNSDFRFQLYLCTEPYGSRPSPVNLRPPWLWLSGIAAGWAVPLAGLVWFSLATYLPANTSPHWMTSERSIRCFSWFATLAVLHQNHVHISSPPSA